MVSAGNTATEIIEEQGPIAATSFRDTDHFPVFINTTQGKLLDSKDKGNKFVNDAKTKFMKISLCNSFSSYPKFGSISNETGDVSDCNPSISPNAFNKCLVPLIRKMNWNFLLDLCKTWIKNPMNMALFVWILCVAISGAVLFMVMTGMLNGALPKKSQRDMWFEVSNQILNALFTLMCLYQHPKRFHHLVLLYRWSAQDILKLRTIYCKNAAQKPNERMHMLVVIALLHLNCFAQYALCVLNLGYPRPERPVIGVGVCTCISFSAPAIASVYNILSPLGREYTTETDQEAQSHIDSSLNIMSKERRIMETKPKWVGGVFDMWDDISLAYLSLFCSCCLFGWNMDRLGFGSMYVHTITFLLFCLAPFFIFNLAAVNIDNEVIREAMGIFGIVICIFGLLYGGFWRIQMRKKFNLPENNFCFGKPDLTNCFEWLCCCPCSLSQEVRTADFYDALDGNFYMKCNSDPHLMLSPLPRENGSTSFITAPSSPYLESSGPSIFRKENSTTFSQFSGGYVSGEHFQKVDDSSGNVSYASMIPVYSRMQREK